jgi:hypothetical protein
MTIDEKAEKLVQLVEDIKNLYHGIIVHANDVMEQVYERSGVKDTKSESEIPKEQTGSHPEAGGTHPDDEAGNGRYT